ncbi:hypothetical protein [Nocardia xishanensis]
MTAALPRLGDKLGGRVIEARLDDGAVVARMRSGDRLLRWGPQLAGGEADCIFYELAIAIADLQAEVEPTLLVSDSALGSTSIDVATHVLRVMSARDRSFQSVVLENLHAVAPIVDDHLDDWSLSVLDRTDAGTQLRQVGVSQATR